MLVLVLVREAGGELLCTVRERAVPRSLPPALGTADMVRAGHDEANEATVRGAGSWLACRRRRRPQPTPVALPPGSTGA